MHSTDADLSPNERRREIATILAAGILRLSTRPEALSACGSPAQAGTPQPASSGVGDGLGEPSNSAQKPLDSGCRTSPHVPAG